MSKSTSDCTLGSWIPSHCKHCCSQLVHSRDKHRSDRRSHRTSLTYIVYVSVKFKYFFHICISSTMHAKRYVKIYKLHVVTITMVCWRPVEINVRENRRGNQKWAIQRNWQHMVHKTKKITTQNMLHTSAQINTNSVSKTWALLQTTGGKYEPVMIRIVKQRFEDAKGVIRRR